LHSGGRRFDSCHLHQFLDIGEMKYPIFAILIGLAGIWFLASAVTEEGLLPSGHGTGWVSEIVMGILALAYSGYRLNAWRKAGISNSKSEI
jgi:hypothetical protein